MQSVFPLRKNPKGACSAAISFLWYKLKRTVVCKQSSHYAKALKVHADPVNATCLDLTWHDMNYNLTCDDTGRPHVVEHDMTL